MEIILALLVALGAATSGAAEAGSADAAAAESADSGAPEDDELSAHIIEIGNE